MIRSSEGYTGTSTMQILMFIQTHFIEGALVCSKCSKEYKIRNGKPDIPKMNSGESEEKKQEKKGTDSEEDF